nr:MAG TPA: hypothetical protein [Caudoviricetes sp.]
MFPFLQVLFELHPLAKNVVLLYVYKTICNCRVDKSSN